jgi:predicted metal-dependent hydrolase
MSTRMELGDVVLDVIKKDIKNVHLSVYPPTGRVRVSAPLRMKDDLIRVFAVAKLPWIRQQRRKLLAQERESEREYVDRESHYVWGRRYLLKVVERDAAPMVELRPRALVLQIRPGADNVKRQLVLEGWYRQQLKTAIPPLISKWERLMDVRVSQFYVQRMKTKWGSCSHRSGSIRLNAELAKKPPECLEYITVHEMVHLLEPSHNPRFLALMDKYMPQWRSRRDLLNRFPVRHESWKY